MLYLLFSLLVQNKFTWAEAQDPYNIFDIYYDGKKLVNGIFATINYKRVNLTNEQLFKQIGIFVNPSIESDPDSDKIYLHFKIIQLNEYESANLVVRMKPSIGDNKDFMIHLLGKESGFYFEDPNSDTKFSFLIQDNTRIEYYTDNGDEIT